MKNRIRFVKGRKANKGWSHWSVLLAASLCTTILAAPPDLTNGGVPTSSKVLNLGPTGLDGWLYHEEIDSSESRQILIQAVDAGSPSDGILQVGDVILGADGTGASPVNFSSDARKSWAQAIADAEARDPATLQLLRWRAGTTTTQTITLQTMGAYTATAPYNCAKSELILEQGLQHLEANPDPSRFLLSTLPLLAANDPSNPNNAARQALAQSRALSLIGTQEDIDFWKSGQVSTSSKVTWTLGHKLVILTEYYLQTNDPLVFPSIEAMAIQIANGQNLFGTMGHQFTDPAPDGSLNGPYAVGYGTVNSAAMPCFLGLLLAKECGVVAPEIDPAIERSSRFFSAYAGYGTIPYGEHEPYRKLHESNGKAGLAALCFSLVNTRVDEAKFNSQLSIASAPERGIGHGGPYFNYLWAPLGANVGGEDAAAAHFSRISWELDLARRWDGGFDFNSLESNGNGNGGGLLWLNEFPMDIPALLTYALPLRQTHITGLNQGPTCELDAAQVNTAGFAADYDAASRTTNELITDLGIWSPKVQKLAAEELGTRTSEHAAILPILIAMANDTNAGESRVGACFALGGVTGSSAAATLAPLLSDPDDELRYAASHAMRYQDQADRLAHLNTILSAAASTSKPFLPLDEEDPLHFAHYNLSMLLFYSGGAYGPAGVIEGDGIVGVDRNLLYPAIEAVAATPAGLSRSTLSDTYANLTQTDIEALAGPIIDSIQFRAPADKMFTDGVRSGGINALQAHGYAEGVPLAVIVHSEATQAGPKTNSLSVLEQYAGSSLGVVPDPEVEEFCEFLILTDPSVAAEAQLVLDAIAADSNPATLTPFKSIQSITADDPAPNLPTKWAVLRVDANDHANGDSVYTWRKIHGAGEVTFTENGTGAAKDTTIFFDGTPGQYLFEVKMSDSRGLTEVSGTVAVTLHENGGTLPPNNPPTANAQSPTVPQATPTPVTLTGTDPEGYALTYTVTNPPSNGTLSGTAPYLVYTSDYDFNGSDSFDFEITDSEGQVSSATVSITVSSVSSFDAAIYEPFDYPAGLLNGQSGASEVGLDGTWSAHPSDSLVALGSLTYGTLGTIGNSVGDLEGGVNRFGGARAISASALSANGLLDDGKTLWFSAVVGFTTGGGNERLALALANDQFNGGNFDYWIKNDGAQLGSGIGITLGSIETVPGRVQCAEFHDLASGDGLDGVVYGSWEGVAGLYGANEHGLIVGKITWGATAADDDVMEIYQPTIDMTLPEAPMSILSTKVDQATFDTLTWARSGSTKLDEIRFGSDYRSILIGNTAMTADTTAPTPNPVGFAASPASSGPSSISMTSATAFDLSGVEYYFTCTTGGGNDSGWQDSPSYTDTGLTPGVQYSYTVTARDKSQAQNATAPSAAASATIASQATVPGVVNMLQASAEFIIVDAGLVVGTVTTAESAVVPAGDVISQSLAPDSLTAYGTPVDLVVSTGDSTPPSPNPMTFAVVPTATSSTSITMTATTANDLSGVEYYFTCTSGGGSDSGWQDSPVFVASGLTASTAYSYTVKARDKSVNQNETGESAAAQATTEADNNPPPTPGFDVLPTALSQTEITMTASVVTDQEGGSVEYYFAETSGNPGGGDSGWQASPSYTNAGLSAGTEYTYTVKARDSAPVPNESAPSSPASETTHAPAALIYEPFNYDIGALNGDAVTGTGLSGTWDVYNSAGTEAGQLTFGGLTTTSGTVIGAHTNLSKPAAGAGATIATGPGSLGDAGLLADGSELWFSALVDVRTTDKKCYVGIGTKRVDGFGRYGGSNSGDEGFGIRVNGLTLQTEAWFDNSGRRVSSPTPLTIGTHLIVGKITWGATEDTIELYTPSSSDLSTPGAVVVSYSTSTHSYNFDQTGVGDPEDLFDTVTFGGERTADQTASAYGVDEIRYGASYAEVVPTSGGGGGDTTPPTLASADIVDDQSGADVTEGSLVTYTLTFSEDIEAATVNSADFSNAGTSPVVIGAITETSPGVFTVEATPTTAGTLQLQVSAGAVLTDVAGNPLDTASAIVDDTTISVVIPNYAPTWNSAPVAEVDATEDSAYSATLADNASDANPGDTLTFAKVSGPAWLSVASDGVLSGTPANGDVGLNSFTVSVSDGIAVAVEGVLEIKVINTNDAPVFASDPFSTGAATEDLAYADTIAGSATDVDTGASLTYAKVSGPAWLSVALNGDLTGTPSNGDVGLNSFTVSVSDGIAAPVQATLNVTVTNVNDAPVFTADPFSTADATEDAAYAATIAGSATDVDAGASLSYAKVSGPAWLSVAANGDLSGTPSNGDVGLNSFTVSVSDGIIATPVEATLNITVLGAPISTNQTVDAADVVTGSVTGSLLVIDPPSDADPGNWNALDAAAANGYTITNSGTNVGYPGGNGGGDRYWEPNGTEVSAGEHAVFIVGGAATYTFDLPDGAIINAVYHRYRPQANQTTNAVYSYSEGASSDSISIDQTQAESGNLAVQWTDSVSAVHPLDFETIFTGPIAVSGEDGFTVTLDGTQSGQDAGKDSNTSKVMRMDALIIDYSIDETAPTLAGTDLVDDRGGANVTAGSLVTYTVSFSEDIDEATVEAADLGNAGTSPVTIGAITETSPGVFMVEVTPTADGSLQLQVNAGAVITDVAGNALDTASAILDDTTLTVDPANVTVPDVVGQAQATAESNIVAAQLTVGTVTQDYSETVPAGDVISQGLTPGASVPVGTAVDLVVSLGIQMVTVPDVVGQTQATAESNIVAAQLTVGTVTQAYSGTVPAGDVISQGLTPGASVPVDSAVDLVVSLGIDPSPKLVRTTVNAVSSTSWTSVDLGQAYNSPVIVATPIYPSAGLPPVVTRITNVTATGFDVKIDRADALAAPVSIDVSIVAVDEGVYTQAVDGVTMEAVKFTSTVTAENNNWVAEARTFQNSYTNPVVVGQVMSANDPNWSVFWSMGSSRTNPVSASSLNVGKHVGEDPNTVRADETIGYIVIEAGSGAINGVAYEAALGGDTVRGFGNSTNPYIYSLGGGLSAASSAAASISGMDGVNGAWAVLSGDPAITTTGLGLHACEDQMNDAEQSHTNTQVAYIVFE